MSVMLHYSPFGRTSAFEVCAEGSPWVKQSCTDQVKALSLITCGSLQDVKCRLEHVGHSETLVPVRLGLAKGGGSGCGCGCGGARRPLR